MKTNIVFDQLKKWQAPFEKYLFPVLLLFYPFLAVNQGVDVSDTTYNLGNFVYIGSMDTNWLLSIFLPSVFGHFLTLLPGAGTMLGMKIYTTLLISALSLIVYYSMKKIIPGWMLFVGEWIAVSVCWCPSVILYNYMSYFFLTMGLLLLLAGIMTVEGRRQDIRFFAAGAFLGANVLVRLPNVTEAAFILVLWFAGALNKKKAREIFSQMLRCVAGYAVGALIPLLSAILIYGPDAYGSMLNWLSGLSADSTSSHGLGASMASILNAYGKTIGEMAIMIPCVLAGMILFLLKKDNRRLLPVKRILYAAGILVLIKYYFAQGVFTTNYYYYDSMFQAAMMLLVVSIVLDLLDVFSAIGKITGAWKEVIRGTDGERILAFTSLLLIVITPFGSDNYTFPVINNLFLIAPITLMQLRRVIRRTSPLNYSSNGLGERSELEVNFTWHAMLCMILLVLLVQGTLFKAGFSFVDGADGTKRDTVVTGLPKAEGMVTSKANAQSLASLYAVLKDADLLSDDLLTFGEMPGLCYLFDMNPAIYTTWATLPSNSAEDFDEAMMQLTKRPVIVCQSNRSYEGNAQAQQKEDILLDYIAENDYNIISEDEYYTVYVPMD